MERKKEKKKLDRIVRKKNWKKLREGLILYRFDFIQI